MVTLDFLLLCHHHLLNYFNYVANFRFINDRYHPGIRYFGMLSIETRLI